VHVISGALNLIIIIISFYGWDPVWPVPIYNYFWNYEPLSTVGRISWFGGEGGGTYQFWGPGMVYGVRE
jgi:hypothetical protein